MPTKKSKRASAPRRTAIVPRIVFQTAVAVAVVPSLGAAAAGCGSTIGPATDSGVFSVAAPLDGGRDAAVDAGFSVVADAGHDMGVFSVAAPLDAGTDAFFSVIAPPPDMGAFSVAIAPPDAG